MKRYVTFYLLVFILILAPILAQDGTQGDPYPAPRSRNLALVFDNNYGAQQIVAAEFVVYDAQGAEVLRFTEAGFEKFPQGESVWSFPIRNHLEPLPNAVYYITVAATDTNGNQSEFSDPPCWLDKKFTTIAPPSGCRIRW